MSLQRSFSAPASKPLSALSTLPNQKTAKASKARQSSGATTPLTSPPRTASIQEDPFNAAGFYPVHSSRQESNWEWLRSDDKEEPAPRPRVRFEMDLHVTTAPATITRLMNESPLSSGPNTPGYPLTPLDPYDWPEGEALGDIIQTEDKFGVLSFTSRTIPDLILPSATASVSPPSKMDEPLDHDSLHSAICARRAAHNSQIDNESVGKAPGLFAGEEPEFYLLGIRM